MSQPTTFEILTWNIYLRPPLVGYNSDWKELRVKLICERIAEFKHFDVIVLQEAFRTLNSRVDRVVEAAKLVGFEHVAYGPENKVPSLQFVDSGLVILSKFPICHNDSICFPPGLASDRFARKGVSYCRIKHTPSDRDIHLFNTHTQASYSTEEGDSQGTYARRMKQLMSISEYIESCVDKKRDLEHKNPIILCGDLNVDALSQILPQEYPQMMRLFQHSEGFRAKDAVLDCLGHHPVTWTEWKLRPGTNATESIPPMRLDYILLFYRSGYKHLCMSASKADIWPFTVDDPSQPVTRLSDHNGVSIQLKLDP